MELINVSKRYGKAVVLDDVNIKLDSGITGLIGKNGAGKTTLMKILCEIIPNFTGDLERNPESQVGYLIEDPKYYKSKSGMFNIKYFSRIYSRNVDQDHIQSLIRDMGMESYIHKKVKTYSMGMKQKLGLVIALIHKPKYLILDEPTNGMDPDGSIDVLGIIKRLTEKYDINVLISSHKLEDIESVSNDIVFISDGRLGEKKSVNDLNVGAVYAFTFDSADCEAAEAVFSSLGLDTVRNDDVLAVNGLNDFQMVMKALSEKGIFPADVEKSRHSVKDFYFEQMRGTSA